MAVPAQVAPHGNGSIVAKSEPAEVQDVPDVGLVSQLLHASSCGNIHLLGKLLDIHAKEGLNAGSCDYDQRTALHLAASEGLTEVAKFLLALPECHVNAKDRWQGTPLDDAVRHRHTSLVDFLVANGALPGDDKKVAQEFMAAVESNDFEAVEGLLRAGANPSTADYDQRSVLHIAVSKGNERIIRRLIASGAELNAKDSFGLTPLDESARRGTRTGENKIRDLLLQLGASAHEKGAADGSSHLFVWASFSLQLAFLVLYATATDFGDGSPLASSARMRTVYPLFVDVHVMIVVGFGFLMTFLRKYGYSSVGFNLLIATMVIQWHILCGGFMHQLFSALTTPGFVWHKIHISVTSLLLADFAAAAVLITFGALLGKVTPLQLYVVAFFEIVFFAINENVLVGSIGIVDVGGSVIVHVFGAYFGLAASRVITPAQVMNDGNNSANYHSDLFAMVGTTFLWIFWPSFVAAPAGEMDREMAVISTLLSLTGSCIAAFQVSHLLRERQFCMVDVQNATLAGGVAIGTIANLAIQSPAIAIATGAVSGALSVVGYTIIQPWLQKSIALHDTCGVHNLHGMPGVLSGLLSIMFAATAQEATFPSHAHLMAAYAPRFADGVETRSAGEQAMAQLLGLITSLAIAVVTGTAVGCLAKLAGKLESRSKDYFLDSAAWEVPELETPFYFDQRGEINRDLFKDLAAKAEQHSIHGGRAFAGPVQQAAGLAEP